MRIAYVIGKFPALSQTFILNQITGLIDRGHQVDVYAEYPSQEEKRHPDIELYRILDRTYYERLPKNHCLRVLKSPALILAQKRASLVKRLQLLNIARYGLLAVSLRLLYAGIPFLDNGPYDIIHCHFGAAGEKVVPLREVGITTGNVITTFHSTDLTTYPSKSSQPIYEHLFAQGDLFLPVSMQWKQRLIAMGCPEKKTFVHHMGVDCRRFSFVERRKSDAEPTSVVTVARLVEMKGLEFGIRAVAKLIRNDRKIMYNIAGDGPLRRRLEQLIAELGIANQVKLLGDTDQNEVCELLRQADIYIHPSVTAKDGDHEGIPVALMEAMASGLPVVTTNHCGIPELVQDSVSGFLTTESNVDELQQRISLLASNRELCADMGKRGRMFVEEHFNIEKLNDTLIDLFEQTLKPEVRSR